MITLTTLKIMSPHVKTFETINDLMDHLENIGYLVVADARHAAEGVKLHAHEDWPNEYSYILSQNGRAHRIDLENYKQAMHFEDLAEALEIQPA